MWASGLLLHCKLLLGTYLWGLIIYFPAGYFALWDSKARHRLGSESVSWCLETSLFLRLSSRDGALSLPLLSLFLSFMFFPTSFQRLWAAFLGAWCPLPTFRSCFMEFTQRSNVLLMNLWGRKWSPCPISLPSSAFIIKRPLLAKEKSTHTHTHTHHRLWVCKWQSTI